MTDVKNTNHLTNERLRKYLNIDHIRQHLLKVGLIDEYGAVVPKHEYEQLHNKNRSRQGHIPDKNVENKQKYQTFIQRPMTAIGTRHPTDDRKNSRKSKSPVRRTFDRRYESTSTSHSRQTNKSQSPTRLLSPNQSTRVKNVSVQRTISPKIEPTNNDQCILTIIYYGPQTGIDYDRNLFEPEGDDIMVTQQHCGGENLIVYKGSLKPNQTFQFESRRHPKYPFALALYVNGLVDHRLSLCCESRYKHNVRIGGKRGLFGIINVKNSRPCRRCRIEQRMKRLAKLKAEKIALNNRISTPEPNLTRSTSPDSTICSRLNQYLQPTNSPNGLALDSNMSDKKMSNSNDTNISKLDQNPNHQMKNSQSNIDIEKLFPRTDQQTTTEE